MVEDRRPYLFAVVALLIATAVSLLAVLLPDTSAPIKIATNVGLLIVGLLALLGVQRTGGRLAKATVTLVAYWGYDRYLDRIARRVRRRLGINLRTVTYVGTGIFKLLSEKEADLIVFDEEHVSRLGDLGNNSLVSLEELRSLSPTVPQMSEFSTLDNEYIVPRIAGQAMGLPLRLGTNAISFNQRHIDGHTPTRAYDLLFGQSELTRRLYAERRIGLWLREEVVMGLVSLWLGNRDPYNLDAAAFKMLCDKLEVLRTGIRHGYYGEKSYSRMREDLDTGEIWLVIGGGEWNADPTGSSYPNIGWTVPIDGAFVWVESVGITRAAISKILISELAVTDVFELFREFLFSAEGQRQLAFSQLYPGAPVNLDLRRSREDLHFLGYDKQSLDDLFREGRLIVRGRPPPEKSGAVVNERSWADSWTRLYGDLIPV